MSHTVLTTKNCRGWDSFVLRSACEGNTLPNCARVAVNWPRGDLGGILLIVFFNEIHSDKVKVDILWNNYILGPVYIQSHESVLAGIYIIALRKACVSA